MTLPLLVNPDHVTRQQQVRSYRRSAPREGLANREATTLTIALELRTEQGIIDACLWQIGDICERNIKADMAREKFHAAP